MGINISMKRVLPLRHPLPTSILRAFLWIPVFLGMTVAAAFAAPPTGVTLSYDFDKSILHVLARHPSDNMDKNYIRRLVIYKNGMQEQELTFVRQKLAAGLEENVSLSAISGDRLRVELFASEGGKGSAELLLEAPQPQITPPPSPEKPAMPAAAMNDY